MKTILFGGFLGSGKTTILLETAKWLTEKCHERDNAVVIIENEVGSVGIDDTLLRSGGYTVQSLFAGCACCTLAGELTSAVSEIQCKLNPEWLLIETTGIANASQIADNLFHACAVKTRNVTVIDAKRWDRIFRAMKPLLISQIQCADVVLINKRDAVDGMKLFEIRKQTEQISPQAIIFLTSAEFGFEEPVRTAIIGE